MEKIDKVLTAYIPKNLDECIEWLDKFVADKADMVKETEDHVVGMSHHGLGMALRNNWKLWEKSPLTEFFYKRKIYHADDMSGIIIRSFYRKNTGRTIDLEGQIKKIEEFWRANPPAPKPLY
jgi:hypothetical protein